MQTKRLSHTVLTYREEILIVEFMPDKDIDTPQAIEQVQAALELTNGMPTCVIVIDQHLNTTVTPEAREHFAKGVPKDFRVSEAIVIGNLAKRLIGNFYIRYHRPQNPAKIFSSFNEAWKWSIEHRDKHKSQA